jgi:hypothetical protein
MRDYKALYNLEGYLNKMQRKYRPIMRTAAVMWAQARVLHGGSKNLRGALDRFCSLPREDQDLIVATMLKDVLPELFGDYVVERGACSVELFGGEQARPIGGCKCPACALAREGK